MSLPLINEDEFMSTSSLEIENSAMKQHVIMLILFENKSALWIALFWEMLTYSAVLKDCEHFLLSKDLGLGGNRFFEVEAANSNFIFSEVMANPADTGLIRVGLFIWGEDLR